MLVYIANYSLGATRSIILHLAATQSLKHAISPILGEDLPLWQFSIIVGVVVFMLGQIRYLTQLSSFFMAGTVAQLVALAIVVSDLVVTAGVPAGGEGSPLGLRSHGGDVVHEGLAAATSSPVSRSPLVADELLSGRWVPAAMGVLNLIFAYGGQFAFLELITSMRTPTSFSLSVMQCTVIMTALYSGFGAVGYWSKGSGVNGIVIFNMNPGPAAQIAAGFIFFQALAQYLVNLNVWTHNLLVLLSRRINHNSEGELWMEDTAVKSTGDHSSSHWLAATAFVASYSAVIAVAVPFFCTLVGFVTSVTYLTVAYTLPAWFAIKLLSAKLSGLERTWLIVLIPLSIILSIMGLVASIKTYINETSDGEEGM
ncbi:hypothetical protein VOLCADRAFT_104490 [Volvox carteri f. nagariensis]|uniref:Amino acid transporter transmembrane domain-containing protein n=1 Tax=Volvox carteri f. nagariensis TaxID=3068 RepID=D8TTY9_VOLCA|nr:uncharacterized protein VOLCADRAFT_104490 [Volvox carteri f. nagariensis]EFJ49048.1 hypothetical protein VOLCADRAFT_104490 [Volvox carteri f. nagariensis]|eukprot:XP_002949945.1 hypothetical protein VOLCADRAFT_104490 [Volvox carteri f. nagariensis]